MISNKLTNNLLISTDGSLEDGLEESCCPVVAARPARFHAGFFNSLLFFVAEKIIMGTAPDRRAVLLAPAMTVRAARS